MNMRRSPPMKIMVRTTTAPASRPRPVEISINELPPARLRRRRKVPPWRLRGGKPLASGSHADRGIAIPPRQIAAPKMKSPAPVTGGRKGVTITSETAYRRLPVPLQSPREKAMREIGHFIGGKEVKGASGRLGDVFDPNTGEVQAKVAFASRPE